MEENQYEKKIFIVNDDKSLLDMYTLEFSGEGFSVTPAFGAVDAIEKLRGGISPDAVVIDIVAPIMDSFELLEVIRAGKLVPNAKMVVLGEAEESTVLEKVRTLGADGYMVKAVATPAQVVKKVMDVLQMNESMTTTN